MVPASFMGFASNIRLSDLLRFMLCCEDAMVLTDGIGRVVHANKAWSDLTGFAISEIEGFTCGFLQGPRTNTDDLRRCDALLRAGGPAEMVVLNYRKDRTEFINHVMIVPIRGGFKTSAITHYCALLKGLD
jgi:PAS domain S-box-containing protein